jgi:hypothetical protein
VNKLLSETSQELVVADRYTRRRKKGVQVYFMGGLAMEFEWVKQEIHNVISVISRKVQ